MTSPVISRNPRSPECIKTPLYKTSLILSLGALVILGAADVISVVIRMTLVQLATRDQMRGRVSAINSLFIGTSNQFGEFESGVTAALFGTVPAAVIGGIGTMPDSAPLDAPVSRSSPYRYL